MVIKGSQPHCRSQARIFPVPPALAVEAMLHQMHNQREQAGLAKAAFEARKVTLDGPRAEAERCRGLFDAAAGDEQRNDFPFPAAELLARCRRRRAGLRRPLASRSPARRTIRWVARLHNRRPLKAVPVVGNRGVRLSSQLSPDPKSQDRPVGVRDQ